MYFHAAHLVQSESAAKVVFQEIIRHRARGVVLDIIPLPSWGISRSTNDLTLLGTDGRTRRSESIARGILRELPGHCPGCVALRLRG